MTFADPGAAPTPAWPLPPEVALVEIEEPPAHPELSDEQERAVISYCRELLRQPTADEAATDALVGFWRLVLAHHDEESPNPPGDDALLAITRRMAAVSMPDRGTPSERRQAMIASIDTEPQCSCRETAFLLAARANDSIEPRESVSLTRHLDSCPECRALDAHMERAAQAFLAALHPTAATEPTTSTASTVSPASPDAAGPRETAESPATPETGETLVHANTPESDEVTSGEETAVDVDGTSAEPAAVASGERLGAGAIVAMAGIVVLAVAGVVATYMTTYHVALASIIPGH